MLHGFSYGMASASARRRSRLVKAVPVREISKVEKIAKRAYKNAFNKPSCPTTPAKLGSTCPILIV